MFHWDSMQKFSQKYPAVLEKLIVLFSLFLVTEAILDIRPDPILQLWVPGVSLSGHAPCEIWEQ